MDEQRCTLNISPKSTPTHSPAQDVSHKGLNLISFFFYFFYFFTFFSVGYGRFKWFFTTYVWLFYLPRCRSRKVFFSIGQLSGQAPWWPAAFSARLAWDTQWKHKIECCFRGRRRQPVQCSRESPGWLSDWLGDVKDVFKMHSKWFGWSVITELGVNIGSYFSLLQGSRMDDQRCSAPQILQNLNSPSSRHKSPSVPDTSEKQQQVRMNVALCTRCKSVIFTLYSPRKMWHFDTFFFGSCFKLSYFFWFAFPLCFLGAVCSRPAAVPQNNQSCSKGAHGRAAVLFTTQQCTGFPSAKRECYK